MRQNRIIEGSITKGIIMFFLPIWMGTFFQQLYNTVDAVIVGNFVGKEALAAVGGSTAAIINLLIGFFVGISSGAGVIISQYIGSGDYKQTKKSIQTAMAIAFWGGIGLTVVGVWLSPIMLEAMGTPDDILPLATGYMRIYFAGSIFNLVYNIGAGALRAMGDSKRPLYFLIICSIVNVVLDIVFVAIFKMGANGAALATVSSQVISTILVVISLRNLPESYRLYMKDLAFDMPILKKMLQIGLPAGLQGTMYTLSNVLIQATVNSFGTTTIAAITAYGKIDSIYWMTIGSLGVATTTFVGQNFGAKKYDRVKKCVKVCVLLSLGVSVFLSVFMLLTGNILFRMFTSDQEVIAIGMSIVRVLVPYYFLYIAVEILSGTMRGVGDTLIPTIMVMMGICVFRIIWIYTVVPLDHTIETLYIGYPISWTITSIFFIIYYLRGTWFTKK